MKIPALSLLLAVSAVLIPSRSLAWGAFSVDRLTGEIRSCSGHESEANAATCSKLHCRGDCRTVATFERTCAAMAYDETAGRAFVARSVDEDEARRETISTCGQAGGGDCSIRASACDEGR